MAADLPHPGQELVDAHRRLHAVAAAAAGNGVGIVVRQRGVNAVQAVQDIAIGRGEIAVEARQQKLGLHHICVSIHKLDVSGLCGSGDRLDLAGRNAHRQRLLGMHLVAVFLRPAQMRLGSVPPVAGIVRRALAFTIRLVVALGVVASVALAAPAATEHV
eukprot:362795-Chlamydomonas_euryale.AAC.7